MKPKTEDRHEKAMEIYRYLKEHRRYCTKEELCEATGCHERVVRDLINYLRNKGSMICSTASKKGYKGISTKDFSQEDADDVIHMLREIECRKLELESMQRCCEKWLKQTDGGTKHGN